MFSLLVWLFLLLLCFLLVVNGRTVGVVCGVFYVVFSCFPCPRGFRRLLPPETLGDVSWVGGYVRSGVEVWVVCRFIVVCRGSPVLCDVTSWLRVGEAPLVVFLC